MGFLESVQRGFRLVTLDGNSAEELANDSESTIYGWIFIVIAGILSSVIVVFSSPSQFLTLFFVSILFTILGILIFHGLAKLFGGQGTLTAYFRAQSHVSILGWISAAASLPIVGTALSWLISIWGIIVGVVVLKSVHKLSTWKAIIVALAIPLILLVLVLIGAAAYFGVLNPDKFLPAKVA